MHINSMYFVVTNISGKTWCHACNYSFIALKLLVTYRNESMTDTQHNQNATLRITGTCMLHKDCVKNNKLIILLIFNIDIIIM